MGLFQRKSAVVTKSQENTSLAEARTVENSVRGRIAILSTESATLGKEITKLKLERESLVGTIDSLTADIKKEKKVLAETKAGVASYTAELEQLVALSHKERMGIFDLQEKAQKAYEDSIVEKIKHEGRIVVLQDEARKIDVGNDAKKLELKKEVDASRKIVSENERDNLALINEQAPLKEQTEKLKLEIKRETKNLAEIKDEEAQERANISLIFSQLEELKVEKEGAIKDTLKAKEALGVALKDLESIKEQVLLNDSIIRNLAKREEEIKKHYARAGIPLR